MATSAVQICSNALLMVGAQTINAFNETSDRAKIVSNLWPNSRDAVLRAHPWNCAVKRAALAPDVTAPAFEWDQQFTIPPDCLRILSIGENGETPEFAIESGKILCDENPLNLRYVWRNEDVTSWDALLVQAAEAHMAATVCYALTKSASQQAAMWDLYTSKLKLARAVDGQEQPPEQLGDYPFISARTFG